MDSSTDTTLHWNSIACAVGLSIVIAFCGFRIHTQPKNTAGAAIVLQTNPQAKPSIPLVAFRVAALSLFAYVWLLEIVADIANLKYYTIWNFSAQTLYLGYAVVHQILLWSHPAEELEHHHRVLNVIFDVIFTTVFVVALVYWTILYNPSDIVEWTTYVVHLANVFVFAVEFCVNEHLVQPASLPFLALWPTLYSLVTWVGVNTYLDGSWPYGVMDLTKPMAPLYWFGIIFGHVICFGFVSILSQFKRTYYSKREYAILP
ncbi:Aste57867_20099 [Aphanomyces stellatus]|uniref:Aste57867_20099 protein n=1 Tax=Aphanomyces stellatus TaxID=120398 RepID=A0A485LIV3_9STRA|nr:hypothetical protein As57867_020033 [Aphanomyces stellatus]VFT96794.1 Aste57867_20099 [Aphanomyces stellatus]